MGDTFFIFETLYPPLLRTNRILHPFMDMKGQISAAKVLFGIELRPLKLARQENN